MKKSLSVLGAVAGVSALTAGLSAFFVAPSKVSEDLYAPFQNRNVAHRGLHTQDKSVPENSMAAFEAACQAGYGIELDVQLTKDGQVVVFHDDDLKRVCGIDARVDSKTLEELEEYRLYDTEQGIPLFAEVLALVAGRSPLIVELKTAGPNNEELCEKTYELLAGYTGEYCIESFDPRIVGWFKKNAPEIVRGQLVCPASGYGENTGILQSHLMANCLLNFLGRPHFIAYKVGELAPMNKLAIAMGAKAVCWTSRCLGHEEGNDTVIFEFYHPSVFY